MSLNHGGGVWVPHQDEYGRHYWYEEIDVLTELRRGTKNCVTLHNNSLNS